MKRWRPFLRGLAQRVLDSAEAGRAVRGTASFLIIQVFGVGITYIVNVLFARYLGPDGFGTFIYAYTWRALLVIPAVFGLTGASLRFVPAYLGAEDWSSLAGFLGFARRTVVMASIGVASATIAAAWLVRAQLGVESFQVFCLAAASLVPHAIMLHASNVLRGLSRQISSQLPQWVLQPIVQLATFLILMEIVGAAASANAAMLTVLVSGVAVLAVVRWHEIDAVPAAVGTAVPLLHRKQWLASMTPIFAIQAITMSMDRADVLVLGTLSGQTEAGIYAAAGRVAALVGFGLAAVNAWAAPMFSERHTQGDHARLQELVRASSRLVFLFTLPATVGVWVLGRRLLGLFGPGFEPAFSSLVILTIGQLFAALAGPVGFLLPMTGGEAVAARILGASAALNLMLNFALVPQLGMEGAAAATSASRVIQNLAMAVAVWRRIRVRTTIL
jgi:O-antigen/teichoic acid export membrane protein